MKSNNVLKKPFGFLTALSTTLSTTLSIVAVSLGVFASQVARADIEESVTANQSISSFAREAVKQCGTVSYDPQGGSLVINNRIEVQVTNASLEANLIREAKRAPFDACLIGSWVNLPRGKIFKAESLDE
jgi:hypothetical protein